MSQSTKPQRIIVLSGGTGRTADQVIRTALAQFSNSEVEIELQAGIRSKQKVAAILERAAAEKSLVCHSLVDPKIREVVDTESRRREIPCIDVLGPALALLGDHLGDVPRGRAGLLYEVHREQIERMDAMDFTLAHDDGKRVADLKEADVVLVGASRTSKSVTCCYLAFRGVRAANVPLISGQPLPKELRRVSRRRVIGLTMNAAHLESIRQSRVERIANHGVPRYADLHEIRNELREIRRTMSDHKWECVDVSYKATEEVASQIMGMLPKSRKRTTNPRVSVE